MQDHVLSLPSVSSATRLLVLGFFDTQVGVWVEVEGAGRCRRSDPHRSQDPGTDRDDPDRDSTEL